MGPIPLPPRHPRSPTDEVQPYYVRDHQDWAVEQERMRHDQALYSYGEYAMFLLMWHIQDFEAGRVERCSRCWGGSVVAEKIAETYGQATQNRCPVCFGTTFEGGWRARIIRPAIFTDTDESEQMQARGVVHPNDVDVESTTDFRIRTGDYVFRSTGDRYQLRVPNRITLRTGFGTPHQSFAAIGYNHARTSLEDPNASVAYLIPPSRTDLKTILNLGMNSSSPFPSYDLGPSHPSWPYAYGAYEERRTDLSTGEPVSLIPPDDD